MFPIPGLTLLVFVPTELHPLSAIANSCLSGETAKLENPPPHSELELEFAAASAFTCDGETLCIEVGGIVVACHIGIMEDEEEMGRNL